MKRHIYGAFLMLFSLLFTFGSCADCDETVLYACHKEGELSIRESPWGDKVGYLYPGDSVTFVKQQSDWTLIQCNIDAGGGWVKSEYLTTDIDGAGEYRNDENGRVHIRKTPKVSKKNHLRWLDVGGIVSVTHWKIGDDGNEWGFVGDGYVLKDCVIKVDE